MISTKEIRDKLENLNWDFTDSCSDLIHNMHPYPAKFIADIPRTLINTLPIQKNSLIFDPFCGSGVTLIEAQRANIESLGVDLNPIACLISKVKTEQLPENFITIANSIYKKCKADKTKTSIPSIPNLDHWFKKGIQDSINSIITSIEELKDPLVVNPLKFCISSIIVKVSNQESDTRYAAIEKIYSSDDVYDLFLQAAQKLHKAKELFSYSTKSRVINKNSLLLDKSDLEKGIGLVITSPPYPNAYEYWLYHKYRMWWLGYDPIEVKEQEIGARAHYFKKDHQTEDDFIRQMDTIFQFLKKECLREAFICFVIGRSKIHGRIIENELIIKNIGENLGFKHISTLERTIKSSRKSFNLSHARIKKEYIVILQN